MILRLDIISSVVSYEIKNIIFYKKQFKTYESNNVLKIDKKRQLRKNYITKIL